MPAHSDPREQGVDDAHEKSDASFENLALLYQGLLTGIVRLQTERQHITNGESFRRRTRATLQEIERVAAAAGYDGGAVADTHFAVVALLDSVVLHSTGPVRSEWERKTLQEELFGQTDAGVVFFDNLERLRRLQDSARLADILEVYLLCLLLGFEGRYSGSNRGELENITEGVGRRIDAIRGRNLRISPSGGLPAGAPAEIERKEHRSDRLRVAALGSVVFTVFLFVVFYWNLWAASDELRARLLSQAGIAP